MTVKDSDEQSSPPIVDLPKVATALHAALALQEISRLRYFYPEGVDEDEARQLYDALVIELENALQSQDLKEVCELVYTRPEFGEVSFGLAAVITGCVFRVPDVDFSVPAEQMLGPMHQAAQKTRSLASKTVQDIAGRVIEIKLFDCRIPQPKEDASFQDRRRFAHLLREYWELSRRIILKQSGALFYGVPHPLLNYIVNLRARIKSCIAPLSDLQGYAEASTSVEELFDALLSSEGDDLSVVPEWTNARIVAVDLFIAQIRLFIGSRKFPMTDAEEVFIKHTEEVISPWTQRVQAVTDKAFPPQPSQASPPREIPLPDEVLAICAQGENQLIELKSAKVAARELTKEIAGILHNRQGGLILYGIEDDGSISGAEKTFQEFDQTIQNSVRNMISPPATLKMGSVEITGKWVFVISIAPWNRKDVFFYEKRVYVRKGTNVFAAQPDEIRKLYKGEFLV